MKKMKKNSFPFFSMIVCSLAIIMIAFIGYFVFNMVSKAPEIVFRSMSAQKPYDGTALTERDWEMESGQLRDGHSVSVKVTGSQTSIGSSKNYFKVTVYDKDKNDVSDQYMIIYDYGILTVYDPDEVIITEIPDSDGSNIDGSAGGGTVGDGSSMGEGEEVIQIFAPRSDVVYLRHKSYGNFTGVDWNERIPSYGNAGKVNPLTYLSYALEQNSYSMEEMKIKADMGVTYTPYHFNNDTDLCDADDRLLPYTGSSYTVNYYYQYDVSLLKQLSLRDEIANEELLYREHVYEHYLKLSANEKGTLTMLANKAGIYSDDENVIELVAEYIQNAATYNLGYEEYPDDVNHALYFLTEAKEGVCVQYATAATLMYRALGIPARYVTGYMGFTEANEWATIPIAIGHAWVEVYIDGLGWIPVEATPPSGSGGGGAGGGGDSVDGSNPDGSGSGGSGGGGSGGQGGDSDFSGGESLFELTLTPAYVSKKYDGTPLFAEDMLTGFEEWEALGYYYQTNVEGEQTEYGYGVSEIKDLTLFDPDGNDITDQFTVTEEPGKIHVYYTELYFSSQDITAEYDGVYLKLGDVTFKGKLMSGHHKVVERTAPKVVGQYANSFEAYIWDEQGEDVSYYYEFVCHFGTLTITPKELELWPQSMQKVFDGTPLVSDRLATYGVSLVVGDKIKSVTISGSQTEIGRSDCILTDVIIVDANGNDVTSNYAITFGVGKLTVTMG